jgi:excisionase family DNA binding protein
MSTPTLRLELPVTDDLIAALAPAVAEILADRQPTADVREWLDVGEAAEHLRCGKSRVYALSSQGALKAYKDGSRSLFKRSDLDAFIESGGAKRS